MFSNDYFLQISNLKKGEKNYSYIIRNSIKAAYNLQEKARQELIQKLKVQS